MPVQKSYAPDPDAPHRPWGLAALRVRPTGAPVPPDRLVEIAARVHYGSLEIGTLDVVPT